jgi:hypothetical protein
MDINVFKDIILFMDVNVFLNIIVFIEKEGYKCIPEKEQ